MIRRMKAAVFEEQMRDALTEQFPCVSELRPEAFTDMAALRQCLDEGGVLGTPTMDDGSDRLWDHGAVARAVTAQMAVAIAAPDTDAEASALARRDQLFAELGPYDRDEIRYIARDLLERMEDRFT